MQAEEPFQTTVKNTALEKHLYSYKQEDGTRIMDLEDLLGEIEGKAAALFEKLLSGEKIVGQERADLASFFAIMYVRTNSFRRFYAELAMSELQLKMHHEAKSDEAFERCVRHVEKTEGRPLDDESKHDLRESMLNPAELELAVPKDWTLQAMGLHDTLAPVINDMEWSIMIAPEDRFFVTGDTPLVKEVPARFRNPLLGVGFEHEKIEVTFPLSPERCWLGHWDKTHLKVGKLKSINVTAINRIRAVYAERSLYAHKRDSGIFKLAKKYKDVKQKLEISGGGGPEKYADVSLHRS